MHCLGLSSAKEMQDINVKREMWQCCKSLLEPTHFFPVGAVVVLSCGSACLCTHMQNKRAPVNEDDLVRSLNDLFIAEEKNIHQLQVCRGSSSFEFNHICSPLKGEMGHPPL